MTYKLFRYTMTMFLALMVSGTLTCCFDYDDKGVGNEAESSDDFSLAFDIALNTISDGATRTDASTYGDDVDNEVDIEGIKHDFRILFFDKDDKFLFEPLKTYYQYDLEDLNESNYESTNVKTKHWRVVIPASALKRDGLLDKIKTNNFKIAVLANWPRSSTDKLEYGQEDKLYKLSHYWTDGTYNTSFNFLTNNGKMGAFTEWVKGTYSGQTAARTAICNEDREDPHTITRKIPTEPKEGVSPHTYKHIWRVWHFGKFGEEVNKLSDKSNIITYWKAQFEKDQATFSENTGDIKTFEDYGGSTYHDQGQTDDCGLSLEGGDGCSYDDEGLMIGEAGFDDRKEEIKYLIKNRLKFNAFAAGKIRICAKKNGANTSLYIQVKDNNSSNNQTNRKEIEEKHVVEELKDGFKIYEYSSNIDVTGAGSEKEDAHLTIPEVVSIYAVGGSMTIKQIEFIEDKHLNDTDREGFLPGENAGQLIPMYGIQEFGPIGDYLVPNELFNLSEGNNQYTHKKVHLLRSLAKVELFIPTGFPQLEHVYIRSINRTSRCEPVDISTPTDQLWASIDDEIDNIRKYGPFYKNKNSHQNRLAWFYNAWTQWTDPWNWNDQSITVPNTVPYPHIFNTRINRSDYAHFIYKGEKNGYDYYVLYVPEKNIDDPTTVGKMDSTPKVPHIELRFKGDNNNENLDDNDCYRIYFTDRNDLMPSISNRYDGVEQTVLENYGKPGYPELYPIMRNHIYRFTVDNVNGSDLKVTFDVDPWDEAELNPKFGNDDKDGVIDEDPWDEKDLNPTFGSPSEE